MLIYNNFIPIISQKIYFHGSLNELPNNTVLTAQKEGYVQREIKFETEFDKHRPTQLISRFDAVFLCDDLEKIEDLGGWTDFVYIVQPIGTIEKSDLGWYTEASMNDSNSEEFKKCSINYWTGRPHPDNMWEYRCKSAKIIRMLQSRDV